MLQACKITLSESACRSLVTIDGPAGVGKSSVARQVAGCLAYRYLHTGAMYRAVTLACLDAGIGFEAFEHANLCRSRGDFEPGFKLEERAVRLLDDLPLCIDEEGSVLLGNRKVAEELRSPEVTGLVSHVAELFPVRVTLVHLQREAARQFTSDGSGLVAEGRDMGSYVFPRARWRFYLEATAEERARRRFLQEHGESSPTDAELQRAVDQLEKRDLIDSQRRLAPLRIPDGAVQVDTTELTRDQVVASIVRRVQGAAAQNGSDCDR